MLMPPRYQAVTRLSSPTKPFIGVKTVLAALEKLARYSPADRL